MSISKLKELYQSDVNIIRYLSENPEEIHENFDPIQVSYDLQSGSYIEALQRPEYLQHKREYGKLIAEAINEFEGESLLEPGCGEGTSLRFVLDELKESYSDIYASDISWSRVKMSERFLSGSMGLEAAPKEVNLAVASMEALPYADNSFDVVLTSHAIEPNHGSEAKILAELSRVAAKGLVLVEPAYEFANDEARSRMEYHGYCRDLPNIASGMGLKVVRHELLGSSANPLNPSAILVLEKSDSDQVGEIGYSCPITKSKLSKQDGGLFSIAECLFYPSLQGIPCLLRQSAILATKFGEV